MKPNRDDPTWSPAWGFARQWYAAIASVGDDLWNALTVCRFSVASVAVGGVLLFVPSQTNELLRDVASGGVKLTLYFVATLLWAHHAWYFARVMTAFEFERALPSWRGGGAARKYAGGFGAWIPRLLGTTALALSAVALLKAANKAGEAAPRLWAASLVTSVMSITFLLVVWKRRKLMQLPQLAMASFHRARDVSPATTRWLLIMAGSTALICLLLVVDPVRFGSWTGALPLVFFSLAFWTVVAAFLVFLFRNRRVPISLVVLLWAVLISRCNDNHSLRRAGGFAWKERGSLHEAVTARLDRTHPGDPLLVVAAEGGGIRAAYWTASVLAKLHDECPTTANGTLAISGVSGGSLGAAVFAALAAAGTAEMLPRVRRMFEHDMLAPALGAGLFQDLLQRFIPWPIDRFDRARAMEASWEHAWSEAAQGDDRFARPFLSLWSPDGPPVPYLLLNSTRAEDGRRVVWAPFRVDDRVFTAAADGMSLAGSDVPLSSAAHLSARFPYVSPLATLDARVHLADGGYFENRGAMTAMDLLKGIDVIPAMHGRQVVVLEILNHETTEPQALDARLIEVFGPPATLLHAREAHSDSASRQLASTVVANMRYSAPYTLNLRRAGLLPLGWRLSSVARNEMDHQLDCAWRFDEDVAGLLSALGCERRMSNISAASCRD